MNINLKYLFIVASLSLWGCNKKYAEPTFELSEPEYTIDTSTNAGKRAKSYYDRTKTFLLFSNLNARDFAWNFHTPGILNPTIKPIKEDEIDAVLDFLDLNLFSYYSDEYMTTYFPYRIPIAEEITVGTTKYNYTESEASILLSNLNKSFVDLPANQQLVYIRGMHNVFLNFAGKKLERSLPEFFEVTNYDYSISSTAADKPDPKELGVWSMRTSSGQSLPPTRINDMIEWVKTLAKYTPEEIQEQFYYLKTTPSGQVRTKSAAMVEKYTILQNELKNKYKTDLHNLEPIF